jgi:3',5'-cyclic AMP phosphodiesterase CpdA
VTALRTLAHVSDLHLGRDARTDDAAAALVRALLHERVDDVLLTGDVTHRGRDRTSVPRRSTGFVRSPEPSAAESKGGG